MATNYTIQPGDTLWGICKKYFKLTNNADIANKVKEVANNNNISNVDLIFAGKTLELGSAMDTVELTGSNAPAATNPIKPAERGTDNVVLTQAQKAADERIENSKIETYDDLNNLAASSVNLFSDDTKTEAQMDEAYREYSQRLLDNYYDINKDGTVTVEEFADIERQGAQKAGEIQFNALGFEISEENAVIAQRSGNLFAKNLDMNDDGIISAEELSFFNEQADIIDGAQDGVIKNAAESAMFESVTGMNANNEDINRVVNKYLLGQELSEDEQKILEQSTDIIRKNMGKAAGLDE